MAKPHSSSFPRHTFPQPPDWPDSVHTDQAAIEQARRELGEEAHPRDILRRAQEIKAEVDRG
jgi:hypothetical protein